MSEISQKSNVMHASVLKEEIGEVVFKDGTGCTQR